MKKIIIATLPLLLAGMVSCKKEIYGCTDSNAANYSNVATDDDGSCFTMPVIPPATQNTNNIFMDEFSHTFGPSSATYAYNPSFDGAVFEDGDVLILEVRSSDWTGGTTYWAPLPYIEGATVLSIWYEYHQMGGTVYIYTQNKNDGSNPWASNFTMTFRAAMIKHKMIESHPGIEDLRIDEVLKIK